MKSVSSRNLIGGFLGGTIGILTSGFVSPLALPFGVLIGVLIGWWNEDIISLLVESHRQAKKVASGLVSATSCVIWGLAKHCRLPAPTTNVFRWIPTKTIVDNVAAVISAPGRFKRWQASHPMNHAITISLATSLLFILGVSTLLCFAEPYLGIEDGEARTLLVFFSLCATMGGALAYHKPAELSETTKLNELKRYYREWEVISHYGAAGFFFYNLCMLVRYTIGVTVFVVVTGAWFTISAMVGFLGVYPIICFIGLARGFYLLVGRSGHWLCLGVTMATTTLSWFVYRESFADPRVLGIVALCTGIFSGGITEVIRNVLLRFYMNTKVGRVLVDKEEAWKIVYGDSGYMEVVIFKCGTLWFKQNRLARIFRAICFDTPVIQPVQRF